MTPLQRHLAVCARQFGKTQINQLSIRNLLAQTPTQTHQTMQPTHIPILISGLVRTCPVVKFNTYTVLVRLPDGHIVKRHLTKHDGSHKLDLAA